MPIGDSNKRPTVKATSNYALEHEMINVILSHIF